MGQKTCGTGSKEMQVCVRKEEGRSEEEEEENETDVEVWSFWNICFL